MTLDTKRLIIGLLGGLFLLSLVFVQWTETVRRAEEAGLRGPRVAPPASSQGCVDCHVQTNPGIVDHWRASTHARTGVGCAECHEAVVDDPDSFDHYGALIATVVTPRDCAPVPRGGGRRVRGEPPRRGGQHPRVARQLPGRDGGGLARAVRPARADARPWLGAGQRARERVLRLPAVPRFEGGLAGDGRGHRHGRRPAARRRRDSHQRRPRSPASFEAWAASHASIRARGPTRASGA